MNCWEVLGIDPTDQNSEVKKAYAKKLRIYHPEEDPQGFQLLREAYDNALWHIKNKQAFNEENIILMENEEGLSENSKMQKSSTGDKSENINKNDIDLSKLNVDYKHMDTNSMPEEFVEPFFEKVQALYNDFFSRIEEKNWIELFNDEVMWRIDCKELINKKMIEFVKENHHFPREVWKIFDDNFHWNQQQSLLYSCYPEVFVNYLLKQINCERFPRYCYFNKKITVDYDKYLDYREEVLNALSSYDYKTAEQLLSLAYELYSNDPDLFCIKGEYYFRLNKNRIANSLFREAININPEDIDTYIFQAKLLFNISRFSESIKICKTVLSQSINESQVIETRCLMGNCYFKLGRFWKARDIYFENLELKSDDCATIRCLSQLADRLYKMLEARPYNFIMRNQLKDIYYKLNQYYNIEKIKLTFRKSVYLIIRIVGYILLWLILIGIAIISRGAAIFILYLIIVIKNASR